jgi:galactonate dehydratase
MRITEIKSLLLTAPRDLHLVKIETDTGLYGLGEAGCSTREYAQEGALQHFRQFLVGMDPMRIEHIWQILYRSAYYEGGRILAAVISAIDMALYDLAGKALNVPVYQLLGGACRDRVFGFRTVGSLSDPDCLARAQEAAADGWPAIRFAPADPIIPRALRPDINTPDATTVFDPWLSVAETAERFAELQAKLPKHVPLGIDFHHRLSVAEAASFCQRIPSGRLAFLEEPIRCENPEAYAALRSLTDVPFAIGEEFASKWAFLPYIERGLTNYARVDVSCVGGLTEARKVAGWCEAHYIDLMPHNPIGPVCTAATVHLAAATNNCAWIECIPQLSESARQVFPVVVERQGPYYPLPARPGLGVEIDEKVLDKYPFKLHEHPHLSKPDGSYTNW